MLVPTGTPGQPIRKIMGQIITAQARAVDTEMATGLSYQKQPEKKLLALGLQAHCGAQKMKALFKQLYNWPSMNNEIHQIV